MGASLQVLAPPTRETQSCKCLLLLFVIILIILIITGAALAWYFLGKVSSSKSAFKIFVRQKVLNFTHNIWAQYHGEVGCGVLRNLWLFEHHNIIILF